MIRKSNPQSKRVRPDNSLLNDTKDGTTAAATGKLSLTGIIIENKLSLKQSTLIYQRLQFPLSLYLCVLPSKSVK